MLCLAASRWSQTVAEGSHGHAPTVHWDALTSGRQLCKLAHKAIAARIVQNIQYVSTAVLLPRHRANSNTGIMTRMSRRLSRRLLAVTSGLSGSAQNAATSGKVRLHNVRGKTAVALNAVKLILLETNTNVQHLKQHNTHCRLNGITSATPKAAFVLKTPFKHRQQKAGALGLP